MAVKTRERRALERQDPGEERAWRCRSSASCQDASITIGTRTAVSSTISSAEAVDAERVVGAEGARSRSWVSVNCMPPSAVYCDARCTTAEHQRQRRRSRGRPAWRAARGPPGRKAVTSAPDERAASDQDGQPGKSFMRGSPPAGPGRRAARRRAGTGRRSGRSRSGAGAAPADSPPMAAAPPSTTPSTPTRSKVGQAADEARAGLDHERVVDRVAVEVGAGGAGGERDVLRGLARDSRLPTRNQAAATPTATTATMIRVITSAGSGGSWCAASPVDRGEEVDDPVAEQQHAAEHRQRGQHDQRDGHHLGRLVRVDAVRPALLAEEGHQHQPGHVEAGDAGAEQGAAGRPAGCRPARSR